jgi:hypothetical protein
MATSYLIINILLIATFRYKNDSTELRYSDYEVYFNFFHISVDFKFKKGQTTSLVQNPYFGIIWQSLPSFISIFPSHRARSLLFKKLHVSYL